MVTITILLASQFAIAANAQQQSPTATPIKHVIFIMKENQSFDGYFEVYPTGVNNDLANNSIVKELSRPYVAPLNTSISNYPGLGWLFGNSKLRYLDSSVEAVDPGEGWVDYHGDWDYGADNGFPAYSGTQSMIYVSNAQIPYYWDYAEEYVLFDNWFTPVMTETLPNRLSSLAGITPVTNDYGPPPYVGLNQTIFWQLNNANLSWGYYELFSTVNDPPSSQIYPLNSISGFSSNLSMMDNVMNISVFYQEARDGTLPAVSFVMPFGLYGEGNVPDVSEHPPANITVGEQWTVDAVNAVMEGPDWNSSAIFITWDEWGGFYDNVPAPQVNSFGYGGRVPALLISPYARENYIDDQVLNHMSVLAFIDYNWHLPALSQWVGESGIPLGAFDFSQQPRAPIILGPSGPYPPNTFPIPLQIPLSELNYTSPAYTSPQSTVKYAVPPSWLPSAQFFLIIISLIAILMGVLSTRLNFVKGRMTYLMSAAVALSVIGSVLGIIYPAIPAPPAPPSQPTSSLLTVLSEVMLVIAALLIIYPLVKKYSGRKLPHQARTGLAIAGIFIFAVILYISFTTPGIIFSSSGYAPSELAPPPTLLGLFIAMMSPLTKISLVLVLTGGVGLSLPTLSRALRGSRVRWFSAFFNHKN